MSSVVSPYNVSPNLPWSTQVSYIRGLLSYAIITNSEYTQYYDKIHAEFEADNDYQSIQKIQSAVQHHGYKMEDTLELFEDMKHLFESDDHFSILEKNVLKGLAHIFK